MSDYFSQVEDGLRRAMREQRPPRRRRLRPRVLALALVALLSAGTALAATGVIPVGSPVPASSQRNPGVGTGVAAHGGSAMLPLRFADPAGGLPWGLRLVRTTRGLRCLQIGRVEDGRLGVLGVDGIFHDDGAFHPLPAGSLPRTVDGLGLTFASPGEDTTCHLAGEAFAADKFGMDRSAGGPEITIHSPLAHLRDVYFGLLGPQAVGVVYTLAGSRREQKVVPGLGAYLIVTASRRASLRGYGDGATGTAGDLKPIGAPILAYVYRIDGKLCARGDVAAANLPSCPWPHFPRSQPAPVPRNLHTLIHASLWIQRGVVRAAKLTFRAPVAVTNAGESYFMEYALGTCHGHAQGYSGSSTDRDVKAGGELSATIDLPFQGDCNTHRTKVTLYYQQAGYEQVPVGSIILHQPPGTLTVPPNEAFVNALRRRRKGSEAVARGGRIVAGPAQPEVFGR